MPSDTSTSFSAAGPLTKGALDENGNRVAVDIELPRWDQSTYWGRANHFFTVTNPANLFVTPGHLEKTKEIVTKYRQVLELLQFNVP